MQDQAIAIVKELCEANKHGVSTAVQNVCIILLQIMEMALHLELCVLQICGIRPVSGRVEDFSKEVKALFSGNVFCSSIASVSYFTNNIFVVC